MARVFITGSTEGLGRAAARTLIEEGHGVILHARSHDRLIHIAAEVEQESLPRSFVQFARRMYLLQRAQMRGARFCR
jgi:short-subunit dehydrogenase